MNVVVKIFLIVLGLLLFTLNMSAMSRRKMRPSIGVLWSLVAVIAVVAGIVLRLDKLELYMSWTALIAVLLGTSALVFGFYISALNISELRNQTQELFMQVALLNEENSRLRKAAEKRGAKE